MASLYASPSPDIDSKLIDQIDQYHKQQMDLFNSMSESVKSAAEMASNIASSMGDISVGGEGGGAGAEGGI